LSVAGRPVRICAATIDTTGQPARRVAQVRRQVSVGPVTISDITFLADLNAHWDDVGSGYYVHLPLSGRVQSWHRGTDVTATPERALLHVPGGGPYKAQWAAGTRVLCVRLDQSAVVSALAALPGGPPAGARFELAMNTRRGYGQAWARLALSLSHQPADAGGLLAQPLVAAPLADSLVRGFLLAAQPGFRPLGPVTEAWPAGVRKAVELMDADPRAPLTVSSLAASCGVSVRALQSGFRRHLGTSPMAHLRDVRLRGAHGELRSADPSSDTVAAIARRWGFAHLGRFASAYEARYGQTPGRTLRAPS
jgi:AraC-like DNA-binding protein